MAVAPPPKRKERKAALYVEQLANRVQTDAVLGIRDERQARRFAQAMILAALFTPGERELFARFYRQRASLSDARRDAEIEELCDRQGRRHLCDMIDRIFSAGLEDSDLLDFIMQAIEKDLWKPVRKEINEKKLRREHFLWEGVG